MYMTGKFEFLSNFHMCSVMFQTIDGHIAVARSVEHAFQASKTIIHREQVYILTAQTAGQAKKLGRRCTLRENWNEMRLEIMLFLLYQKFHDKGLLSKLRAVDEPLVEHNRWHDNYWGECVCNQCQADYVARNWLGKLLREVSENAR